MVNEVISQFSDKSLKGFRLVSNMIKVTLQTRSGCCVAIGTEGVMAEAGREVRGFCGSPGERRWQTKVPMAR